MSVLIKGFKMPETCIECPMQFGGFCYVQPPEIDEARVAPTVDEAWEQGKPEWCPLCELPKNHGRLIDADELKKHKYHDNNRFENAVAVAEIDWADTIIEAEREVEE